MSNKKSLLLLCPAIIYLLCFINADFKWGNIIASEAVQNNNFQEKNKILQNNISSIKNVVNVESGNVFKEQNFLNKIRRHLRSKNEEQTGRELVWLASSFGRSGSTWVSEMISSTLESFYVYEPFYFQSLVQQRNMSNVNIAALLKRQFQCKLDLDFVKWASERKESSDVFRSYFTKHVCRNTTKCITENNMKNNCEQSTNILIKTIRAPVSVGQILLQDPYFKNLKIIFLVRDPRASLLSRAKLKWDFNPADKCKVLEKDVQWYNQLSKQYPDNIRILRYENLCISQMDEAASLWQFLKGNSKSKMSFTWKRFMTLHSSSNGRFHKAGIYNTYRNTSLEWQNWRHETNNKTFLQEVEKYCKSSLNSLGYTIFQSIHNLQNMNLSMLTPKNMCPNIPCDNIQYS